MTPQRCQYENPNRYQRLTKQEVINLLCQRDIVVSKQQSIINVQRDQIEQLATELYWHSELQANPLLNSNEKESLHSYYDYMVETPLRNDESKYYSLQAIANKLGDNGNGNKRQKFAPIHKKLEEYGYIKIKKEKQKNDKNKDNYYDILSLSFLIDPRNICLDSHSLCGGKRIAIHKDCGGICSGRMIYLCTRCGEDYIEEKNVSLITEDELENRIDLENNLPSLKELDSMEFTTAISNIPQEKNNSDIEAFHRAMRTAKSSPRKQKYALEADIVLPYKEMEIQSEKGRDPPDY